MCPKPLSLDSSTPHRRYLLSYPSDFHLRRKEYRTVFTDPLVVLHCCDGPFLLTGTHTRDRLRSRTPCAPQGKYSTQCRFPSAYVLIARRHRRRTARINDIRFKGILPDSIHNIPSGADAAVFSRNIHLSVLLKFFPQERLSITVACDDLFLFHIPICFASSRIGGTPMPPPIRNARFPAAFLSRETVSERSDHRDRISCLKL